MKSTLTGLIAAPHTPFDDAGALNAAVIPRQAALLVRNGVAGAFVCGTTGEGASLTLAERFQVVEEWIRVRQRPLAVIVHVGHQCLADSRALAAHAQAAGADAIATIAPSFFKPPGAEELAAWCAEVATAAPRLPFYYYHMPAMTGVQILATDFLEAAQHRIPTLAGVKFTHENLLDFGRAGLMGKGRYEILFGRDEILLAGLALGARGAVGSTYNFAAPLYLRIMEAFSRGDLKAAKRDQEQAMAMIEILHRHGGLAAGKTAMKLIGVDCGAVRLPLRRVSAASEQQLRGELEKVGFFDFCSRLS